MNQDNVLSQSHRRALRVMECKAFVCVALAAAFYNSLMQTSGLIMKGE